MPGHDVSIGFPLHCEGEPANDGLLDGLGRTLPPNAMRGAMRQFEQVIPV
jgi:hypothetical protein